MKMQWFWWKLIEQVFSRVSSALLNLSLERRGWGKGKKKKKRGKRKKEKDEKKDVGGKGLRGSCQVNWGWKEAKAMSKTWLRGWKRKIAVNPWNFWAPRSIEASKSVESTLKSRCGPQRRNQRRASKTLFGPRKSRCVDFIMQRHCKLV